MTKYIRFLALSLAVMTFSAIGIQAATVSGGSQNTLEQEIKSKILSMPYYGVFDAIGFEVDGDTVVLTGKVFNGINRKSAANRVAKIEGVRTVINKIELLPPSGFDNRIRRQTLRAFLNTGGLYRFLIGTNPSMRIIVDNGHITLEGVVNSKADSSLANVIAQGIPGVFSVTNNLEIEQEKR